MIDLALQDAPRRQGRGSPSPCWGSASPWRWSSSRSASSSACWKMRASPSTSSTPTSGSRRGTRPTSTSPTRSPSPTSSASASIPGVARADNLIVWYAIVALPSGAKESVVYYGLDDFPTWSFPWDVAAGRPRRPPPRPVRDARRIGRAPVRRSSRSATTASSPAIASRSSAGPARPGRSRRARSPSSTTGWRRSSRPTSWPTGRRSSSPGSPPAPMPEAVAAEIRRRLPYNDVYTRAAWAATSRAYWIESTGLGLTMFLTVSLGGLVGVVIVAQTLYASISEHLPEFGTVKALGGRDIDVYGHHRRAGRVRRGARLRSRAGADVWPPARPGRARHDDDRDADALRPRLRRHAGPLPGGVDALLPQGRAGRPGDRLPGIAGIARIARFS